MGDNSLNGHVCGAQLYLMNGQLCRSELETIEVDASKDCYMVLNDLVSEQVRYGPQSRCATANHKGL